MSNFDLNKYLGTWYELIHYPSWFQRNDNYNTTATYSLNIDGSVSVSNRTMSRGQEFISNGTAQYLGGENLMVRFSPDTIGNLLKTGEYREQVSDSSYTEDIKDYFKTTNEPNYVIDMIWTNKYGQYIFAVVTDPSKKSLFVLSRYPHPSIVAFNQVIEYVVNNYDRDRLVQTGHFS